MGVYIKGITAEMLRNAPLEAVEELMRGGEMIEVKEPHGDLIDMDEVLTFDTFDEEYEEHSQESMTIRNALALWAEQMPQVVIEAEGE